MRVLCLIDRSLRASQGDIMGAAHVYLASEKRLLSASVTLHVRIHTWIPICTDTHAHTHKEALLNSRTPTPSLARPGRRACLCQQISGRRCVFLCLSLHSFHLLLQRLPICLRPHFISFHPTPAPPPPPTTTPEDSSGSVVFQTLWHCLFRKRDPAFHSRRFFPPVPPKTSPVRPTEGSLTKVIKAFSSRKIRRDPSLIAAPSAVLSSKVISAAPFHSCKELT